MTHPTPAYDNKIARKYSAKTLDHKRENKIALQEELGWVAEPKRPIVCISTGMTDALGGEMMTQILPGLEALDVELLIRGRGSEKYGKLFTELSRRKKHRVSIMQDDEDGLRKMLSASDIALFFAPPQREELEMALRYGVVPVSLPADLLEDYNPVQESGNAFLYTEETMWHCFTAVVRALETLKFPFDWRTIQRHAMETLPQK